MEKEKMSRDDVVAVNKEPSKRLCKKCKLRSAAHGSSRCQQCSDEYNSK